MEDLESSQWNPSQTNTDCILKREEGEKKKLLDISVYAHLYITKRELQS